MLCWMDSSSPTVESVLTTDLSFHIFHHRTFSACLRVIRWRYIQQLQEAHHIDILFSDYSTNSIYLQKVASIDMLQCYCNLHWAPVRLWINENPVVLCNGRDSLHKQYHNHRAAAFCTPSVFYDFLRSKSRPITEMCQTNRQLASAFPIVVAQLIFSQLLCLSHQNMTPCWQNDAFCRPRVCNQNCFLNG